MNPQSPELPPTGRDVPAKDMLARAVRRAAEAASPIVVADLVGSGQPFTPSRGERGTRYGAEAMRLRDIMKGGARKLTSGLALYPQPDPGVQRVIVLAMDDRNWLPYDEELERTLLEIVRKSRISSPPGNSE